MRACVAIDAVTEVAIYAVIARAVVYAGVTLAFIQICAQRKDRLIIKEDVGDLWGDDLTNPYPFEPISLFDYYS